MMKCIYSWSWCVSWESLSVSVCVCVSEGWPKEACERGEEADRRVNWIVGKNANPPLLLGVRGRSFNCRQLSPVKTHRDTGLTFVCPSTFDAVIPAFFCPSFISGNLCVYCVCVQLDCSDHSWRDKDKFFLLLRSRVLNLWSSVLPLCTQAQPHMCPAVCSVQCVCVIAAHQPVHLFDVGLNRLTPPLTTPSSLLHTAEKCTFKNHTSVTW